MVEITLNIGDPKSKKTFTLKISGDDAKTLIGKKIGDTIRGELFGKPGYEFLVTGGSNKAGFPMRRDLEGGALKKILTSKSIGVKTKSFRVRADGLRRRKSVAGNTISDSTAQVNLKILKYGVQPLIEKSEETKDSPSSE